MIARRGVWATGDQEEIIINIQSSTGITNGRSPSNYNVSYTGYIRSWRLVGNNSGTIQLNILKKHDDVPSAFDIISGTSPPTLNNETTNEDTSLTEWSTTKLIPGDILGIYIDNASNLNSVTLSLLVDK